MFIVTLVLLLVARSAAARPVPPMSSEASGQLYLAVLQRGLDASDVAAVAKRIAAQGPVDVEHVWESLRMVSFRLRTSDPAPEATLHRLKSHAGTKIEGIHADSPVHAAQTAGGDQPPIDVAAVLAGYSIMPLSSTRIAILDTGLNASHPEMAGVGLDARDLGITGQNILNNMYKTGTTIPLDTGSALTDLNGHGTFMAGTMAALQNNAGMAGIGGAATIDRWHSLVPVKVMGPTSTSGTMSNVISGMNWVMTNARALSIKVAVISLAGSVNSAADQAVADLTAAGVLVVVAAGNIAEDINNQSPSRAPAALTVTSVDSTGTPSPSSSYALVAGKVVASYGVNIYSTGLPYTTGGFTTKSGTSFAAPHIAALAAWCMEHGCCQGMSPAAVRAKFLAAGTNVWIPKTVVGTVDKHYGPIVTKKTLCG